MDTWLRRVAYNKILRWLAKIGIYIATFTIILSMVGMERIPEQVNYFDSADFRELFVKKAGYVRDWIVRYDEDKIFSQVTQNQIDRYIQNSGRDISQEEAIEGILADRNNYYSTIQNELVLTNKNLDYFAMDVTTGRYVTNMEGSSTEEMMKEITSRSNYLIGNGYYILNLKYGSEYQTSYYSDQYAVDMNYYAGEMFEGQGNYRVYMALKEELVTGDDFYVGYKYSKKCEELKRQFYNMCVAAVIMDIILAIYYLGTIERKMVTSEEGTKEKGLSRVPFEIQLIIAMVGFFFYSINLAGMYKVNSPVMTIDIEGVKLKGLGVILYFITCLLPTFMELSIVSSWVKRMKNRSFLEHIWIFRLVRDLYHTSKSKTKTTLMVSFFIGINIIVDIMLYSASGEMIYRYGLIAFLPIFLWNLIGGVLLVKLITDYRKIFMVAKAITEGELDKKVELGMTYPMLEEMAVTVNSMGTGLEKAVGESIKSERLKTELITNVSHDLKTPLTSIISYIDLLKGEAIENATAREYINVLDERSHRLKQLVEDLVEASKAITGNLKADMQFLRLDELIGQAIGEYQDRMELIGLIPVTDKLEEVCILADGRHMWRVVENLLSNVCKYAMPHTRVYIEVYSEGEYGYCTIKNISKEPLNIDPNELTERFVRGDASRTTEGSGLGLAIAQSLLIIQQGLLEITIDGDLFKIQIKVPLAKIDEEILEKKQDENLL